MSTDESTPLDFIANFTHELRNSLNSIVLFSKLLMENRPENLTEEQLDYARAIENSGNSLLEMVNEVLDLSKLESGQLDIELESTALKTIFDKIKRIYGPIARQKGIIFETTLAEPARYPIVTDRIRLEQILKNLLSNAFKFTSGGHITLHAYLPKPGDGPEELQGETSHIALQLEDTGIGIPKNQQEHIFERYRQAEPQTHRKYGGTGLGLSISRDLAVMLGGQVTVESEPGRGSVFTLYLPTDSREALSTYGRNGHIRVKSASGDVRTKFPEEPSYRISPEKRSSTVLLIDDSELQTAALKEFLEFRVESCLVAPSASRAFELLEGHPIDCVILDMFLPDADGYEVLERIKANGPYEKLPVIIYTGMNLTGEEMDQIKQKAASVVYKNAESFKMLTEAVSRALEQ